MTAPLETVYADLHVHLGGIKMAAAMDLTVAGILEECLLRKGIGMVGIIDAAAPPAMAQLHQLAAAGDLEPLSEGGLAFRGRRGSVTLILGCEVEVYHDASLHLLCYFPDLGALEEFSRWQSTRVKNPNLSTQRHRATAAEVVAQVAGLGGFVIPAHCFTPHKSILAAAGAISPVIPPELWAAVPAVELGLSADTGLADQVPELAAFSYVSSSDAHSRGKIAREYNELWVAAPTFAELRRALVEQDGRRVAANYGLEPRLGKYHRSFCLACDRRIPGPPPQQGCANGARHRIVLGVLDRVHLLVEAAPAVPDRPELRARAAGRERPPYVPQVPLQFVPGLGRRALDRLLSAFGTEMAVLHRAAAPELAEAVGPVLAARIDDARSGRLRIEEGAGGIYGKVKLGGGR